MSIEKIEKYPSVGFEPSIPELLLDYVTTDSNMIQARKFRVA